MEQQIYTQGGIALLAAFMSWFIGEFDGTVRILIVMVILDQITGVLKSGVKGVWSSNVGFHGIARKITIFVFVGITNILENEFLGHSEHLRDAVIYFYVINETLSIFENAIEIGVPVPEWLKDRFMTMKNKKLVSKNEPPFNDAD